MAQTVTMRKQGEKPISFKRGALHAQLGVPQGEAIPAEKKAQALAGEVGALAKKRANFGFRTVLKAGRATAARKATGTR